MDRDEIRLECIKLSASKTSNHQETMVRAEEYFGFVMTPEIKAPEKKIVEDHKKSSKQVGNTKTRS